MKKRYLDWHQILMKAVKDIDNYPPQVLGKRLGLSNSNFFRLCLKFQKLRDINNSFNSSYLNDERAFRYTKYLITEILKYKIDEHLPKKISQNHKIFKGQYSALYTYALDRVKKDIYWKNFNAAAFLICGAFPNNFLPYQFQKPNTFLYFDRKDNFLKAMIEVFKLRNDIDLTKKDLDSDVKYSLIMDKFGTFSEPNLRLYGLSRKFWSKTFDTINAKDLRLSLIDFLNLNVKGQRDHTKNLISKLNSESIDPKVCFICGEKRRIEIHHIINVKDAKILKKNDDINDTKNLIPLCVYHHDDAKYINLNSYYKKNGYKELFDSFVNMLSEKAK